MTSLIVFTDLDGTLLDHETYGYQPAALTVLRLKRRGIPLILASSKTASEMIALRSELGFDHCPMICENGAGMVPPGAVSQPDQESYFTLRATLNAINPELRRGFVGFGDMGPDRIAAVTGLPLPDATRAATRQFSEPGIYTGSDAEKQAFLEAMRAVGVEARQGGRFLTLSFGQTKADQMAQITGDMSGKIVIALGDAPNDAEMLSASDYAIVLPNAQGHPVTVETGPNGPKVIRARQPGPLGWNTELGALLTRLGVGE